VILLATMIKRRVALPSTEVRQTEHAAVVRPTPTLVSFTPIMPHHGLLLVARIPCRIQSLPQRSSPLSWSAARLHLVDNMVVRVLRDFLTLQHRHQPLPQLQVKVVVGMLIMLHHGLLLVARIPCRIQSLPQRSYPLSWSAARLHLVDNMVVRVLRDFLTLQHRHQLLPQLQAKVEVGMLIMLHHGLLLVARIPCHIQVMPQCSLPPSWSAVMLPLVDNMVVRASTEFLHLQAQLQLQARHLQHRLQL